MVNIMNRGYNFTSLESEFKTEFCNDYGYTLDFKKKEIVDENNLHKTCCNHKKKVNKKVNNKK